MRSILAAADYTSPQVLQAEERNLFRRLWILAGFRSLLAAPDAFLTHRVGGVPIVVQNTAGGLRAYVNRCAHRHAPVQIDDFGARRLACPYHGWVYDGEGRARSIPGNEANYGFDDACVAGLGLAPVALRTVGGLVFVNLDRDPMPLEAQFHPSFLARAEEISGFAGDDALFAKFEAAYNWKLNFENVVDWNHIPFVHAASFARAVAQAAAARGAPALASAAVRRGDRRRPPGPVVRVARGVRPALVALARGDRALRRRQGLRQPVRLPERQLHRDVRGDPPDPAVLPGGLRPDRVPPDDGAGPAQAAPAGGGGDPLGRIEAREARD